MEATEALLEIAPPCNSDEKALAVLPVPVRAWFAQRFGRPTATQRAAWPVLAADRNLLLSAPTGTGKTLAAFAPLLGELLTLPLTASVRCLYLTPLKALGNDIRKNLRSCLAGLQPFPLTLSSPPSDGGEDRVRGGSGRSVSTRGEASPTEASTQGRPAPTRKCPASVNGVDVADRPIL